METTAPLKPTWDRNTTRKGGVCETVKKGLKFWIIFEEPSPAEGAFPSRCPCGRQTHLTPRSSGGGRSVAAPGTVLAILVSHVIKCISLCRGKTSS